LRRSGSSGAPIQGGQESLPTLGSDIERRDAEPKEPIRPWLLVNVARLAIYLTAAAFLTAVVFVVYEPGDHALESMEAVFGLTISFAALGALFGLPGTAVWLAILARLSPDASVLRRRLILVATGPPLIGIVWIVYFSGLEAFPLALTHGLLLPAGSGLVVRLRRWERMRVLDETAHLGF
jgi:hypothetical protein